MSKASFREPWVWWAGICLCWLALILWLGHDTLYYSDDWNFVLDRRTGMISDFTAPHVDHVVVVPVFFYKASWAIFGVGSFWPLRVVGALFYLACATMIVYLVRRRCDARLAVLAGVLFLVAGQGWASILLPFQMGFVQSVLFGLVAFAALDRDGRWSLPVAAGALLVSSLSSGVGAFVIGAVGLELIVAKQWRRLVVLIPAVVAYGTWYLAKSNSSAVHQGIPRAPGWALEAASAAAAGIFGLPLSWGPAILVAFVAGLLAYLWRRPASPRLIGLLALGGAFLLATGVARSYGRLYTDPATSRYLILGFVVLLLAAAELLRDVEIPDRVIAASAVLVLVATALGLTQLRTAAKALRGTDNQVRGSLLAFELLGPAQVDPDYWVSPQISAGRYFANGTAVGKGNLQTQPAEARAQADLVLSQVAVKITTPAVPSGRCKRVSGSSVILVKPGGVLTLKSGQVNGTVRRFGAVPRPLPALTRSTGVHFTKDADPTPYTIQLAVQSPAVVCSS